MRLLGFIMALLMTGSVFAQGIEISCDGISAQAITDIPKPADKFLRIACTQFGQVLTPTAGWFWTAPGIFNPKFFPAQMVPEGPKETGNSVFFKSIQVDILDEKASQDKWALLAKMFPPEAPPKTALEIKAENNTGNLHSIYIFPNSWGYSCSPTCRVENAFILINQDKLSPQW